MKSKSKKSKSIMIGDLLIILKKMIKSSLSMRKCLKWLKQRLKFGRVYGDIHEEWG